MFCGQVGSPGYDYCEVVCPDMRNPPGRTGKCATTDSLFSCCHHLATPASGPIPPADS